MSERTGSEKRKRSIVLTVRVSPEEAQTIRDMAERSGMSVGALVRRALLWTIPPRAQRRPAVEVQAVARLLGQLGKIGSNLNQLAHYANAGRNLALAHAVEPALRELADMRLACLQALGHEVGRDPDDRAEEAEPPAPAA